MFKGGSPEPSEERGEILLFLARLIEVREAISVFEIRKRYGRIEEFVESKIAAGVRKAEATAEEPSEVAKEVSEKVAYRAHVTAEMLSRLVVTSPGKVNKKAVEGFIEFRYNKLRAERKSLRFPPVA